MKRIHAAALATLAASALVTVGCSSTEDKNQYVDTVNEIQQTALDAFNETTTAAAADPTEQADQLQSGADALATAVDDLNEVDVPEDAQDAHPDLVAGIDDLRALFDDTAKKVKKGNATDALTLVTEFTTQGTRVGTEIDATIAQLNQDIGAE